MEAVLSQDKTVPSLIRIGLIEPDKLNLDDWSEEVEIDSFVHEAAAQAKTIFAKANALGHKPEEAGSMTPTVWGESVFADVGDMNHALA